MTTVRDPTDGAIYEIDPDTGAAICRAPGALTTMRDDADGQHCPHAMAREEPPLIHPDHEEDGVGAAAWSVGLCVVMAVICLCVGACQLAMRDAAKQQARDARAAQSRPAP